MNYMNFYSRLKKLNVDVFSLREIQNLFPGENLKTIKNNLTRWLKRDYIRRIRRDLYELTEREIPDFYLANRIYAPSYISLETALSFYSIIPEVAVHVTSVTTKPTREFKTTHGLFIYHTCKKSAFLGYYLLGYDRYKVLIADKEKALVDFLYFRKNREIDFDGERFNERILKEINWEKAEGYAELFDRVTVNKVENCKNWLK